VIQLEQFRKKKAAKKATAASAEQAKAPAPDVAENPPPIANTGSLGDGPASDVEPNQASTSSVPSAVYENGPVSASRGAEFPSNGPVTVNTSVGVSNVPQQDAVSDGGSKFYGNLSFSDLVNGHHENWRGDEARKRDEHSPDKDVQSTSKLSAFGNNSSLTLPSTDNMPSWVRNSLSGQAHDTEQSSSYSSSTLFGKSENAYTQDYSANNDIFGRLRGKFEALYSYAETTIYNI
jgi:hypothetical protein